MKRPYLWADSYIFRVFKQLYLWAHLCVWQVTFLSAIINISKSSFVRLIFNHNLPFGSFQYEAALFMSWFIDIFFQQSRIFFHFVVNIWSLYQNQIVCSCECVCVLSWTIWNRLSFWASSSQFSLYPLLGLMPLRAYMTFAMPPGPNRTFELRSHH